MPHWLGPRSHGRRWLAIYVVSWFFSVWMVWLSVLERQEDVMHVGGNVFDSLHLPRNGLEEVDLIALKSRVQTLGSTKLECPCWLHGRTIISLRRCRTGLDIYVPATKLYGLKGERPRPKPHHIPPAGIAEMRLPLIKNHRGGLEPRVARFTVKGQHSKL